MSLSILRYTCAQLEERKERVRVVVKSWDGTDVVRTGYVNTYSNDPANIGAIYLHHRKGKYAYCGGRYVALSQIQSVTTSTKDRKTKTYRTLYTKSPLVVTADGHLDMSQSLRALLGCP